MTPPLPVFVTTCWTWQNRSAARKHLKRIDQSHSFDMAFLQLRGALIQALQRKKNGYKAADTLLKKFHEETRVSKRKLKDTLGVIGVCITTATEEFADLPKKLKQRDCCANRNHVKEHAYLRALLIHT